MRARFPLYLKIVAWFMLNLALLAVAAFFLFRSLFGIGPDAVLKGASGEKIRRAVQLMNDELRDTGRDGWEAELQRFSSAYGMEFSLYRSNGEHALGPGGGIPDSVHEEIKRFSMPDPGRRGPGPGPGGGPRRGPDREPPGGPGVARPGVLFLVKSGDPRQYWLGARVRIGRRPEDRPQPGTGGPRPDPPPDILLGRMDRMSDSELMPDFRPWMLAGVVAVGLSALFWIPFVGHITRSLRRMRDATEEVASGNFEAQVDEQRTDELGQLGRSINRMSDRLAGYVHGQRRFLGDIAHELCSPIARMQLELGVLEQGADPALSKRVDSVRHELDHMADMVNELLSFSKASLQPESIEPERVALPELIREVAERETGGRDAEIGLEHSSGLAVMADRKLLERALGNVLRNAMRYAGEHGPISIDAQPAYDGLIAITVRDSGPGIDDKALENILEPFYRPDEARTRERGGAGLGLAIVKTCIEACGGHIRCRNADPGFEVSLLLPSAPS